MPLQLRRILLIFACMIGLFLIIRKFAKPDSFGQYGHYRGEALIENQVGVIKYVGDQTCNECHSAIVELKAAGLHDVINCEICHGAGYLHLDTLNYVEMPLPDTRENCGRCHNELHARSSDVIFQIDLEEHNKEQKCIKCHNPHEPWEEKENLNQEEDF